MTKDWKYYLIDKATGDFLTWNGSAVISTATPTELEHSPDGWQDIAIGWERDMNKLGVFRNFTVPFGFVLEGAEILRNVYAASSVKAEIILRIEQRKLVYSSTSYQETYPLFYEGEIDLTTYKDDGLKVSVQIAEGGVQKKLKAQSNSTFPLPMNQRSVVVKMDGINIAYGAILKSFEGDYESTSNGAQNHKNIWAANVSKVSGDEETANLVISDVIVEDVSGITYATDPRWFIMAGDNVTINLDLDFVFSISQSSFGNFKYAALRIIDSNNTVIYDLGSHTQAGGSFSQNYVVKHTLTISLVKYQKLFLIADTEVKAPLGNVFHVFSKIHVRESTITINYTTRFQTTYVKGKLSSVVAKELTGFITGDENDIDTSAILDNFILLPGDSIRGLPIVDAKTSFDNFSKFVRVVMALGQGFENGKITFGDYDHFFPLPSPVTIPKVKNLVVSDSAAGRFNKVRIGYPVQDIGGVNGKYEFNNTNVYQTPDNSNDKELDLVCPYPAQAYMIERIRINFDQKKTTDGNSDNTIFIVNADPEVTTFTETVLIDTVSGEGVFSIPDNPDKDKFVSGISFDVSGTTSNNGTYTVKRVEIGIGGYNVIVDQTVVTETPSATFTLITYVLKREVYDNALTDIGIPDPVGIFNIIGLTPAGLMEKHRKYIDSWMYGFTGVLKYLTTEQNPNLKTVIGPDTVDEDADIPIGTNILFIPVELDTDAQEPIDLVSSLAADPNSSFVFGNNVQGFLLKAGIQPDTKQEQAYKLLAAPNTDLLNIHRDAYK